ncbi:MAG: NUDIX hydrolase [Anaerolineae bacterium]
MLTLAHVQQALQLPDFDGLRAQLSMSPAGRERMTPDRDNPPRSSAVLVLVYPRQQGRLHLLLTRRTDHLRGHSGQISFPGGRRDHDDESLEHTALREACEEVGICDRTRIILLGHLTRLWIPPSNFSVQPIVASLLTEPDLTPSPDEVAQIVHMPLEHLFDDHAKKHTQMHLHDRTFDVPYYDVDGHIVWGATAAMLSELECRLRAVLNH